MCAKGATREFKKLKQQAAELWRPFFREIYPGRSKRLGVEVVWKKKKSERGYGDDYKHFMVARNPGWMGWKRRG